MLDLQALVGCQRAALDLVLFGVRYVVELRDLAKQGHGAVRLDLFGGGTRHRYMFGHSEAVQIVNGNDAVEVGVDEERSGAVAATDGHGLEHWVLDLGAVAEFVNDGIEHDKFRHNAVDVRDLAVAGLNVLIGAAFAVIIKVSDVDTNHSTLPFGGVPRKVDEAMRRETSRARQRQKVLPEPVGRVGKAGSLVAVKDGNNGVGVVRLVLADESLDVNFAEITVGVTGF